MSIIAKLKYLRIAPRKVRLVADLIRKKRVQEAQVILNFTTKRAVKDISKLLNSGIANAKHNFHLDEKNLYISKIIVDEGPKYKRWRARARGQACEIQKKASHITLVLKEYEETVKKTKGKKAIKKAEEIQKNGKERKISAKAGNSVPKFRAKEKILKPKIERSAKKIFKRKAF